MIRPLLAAACLFFAAPVLASPPTTLTVQGYLTDSGQAVQGDIDVAVTLYDDPVGGVPVGPRQEFGQVQTQRGTFSVEIDGTAAGIGDALWAEIEVRSPSGAGAFTTLSERLALTAAPFAMYALNTPAPPPEPSPPQSSSGLPPGASFVVATDPPSGASVQLVGGVSLERSFTTGPGTINPTILLPSKIVLRRDWVQGPSAWRDALVDPTRFRYDVELILLGVGDETRWRFESCVPTNWELAVADDGGPVERLELTIDTAFPSTIERINTGPGVSPRVPVLLFDTGDRGGSPADDFMRPEWDRQAVSLSIVDDGYGERVAYVSGQGQVSGVEPTPFRFSRSVMTDNLLFESFLTAATRDASLGVYDFRDNLVESVINPTPGLIVKWELVFADDRLPYERFEIITASGQQAP